MKTTKTARNKEVAGATIDLSKPEAARLSELEEKIDSGLKTFLEVGRALKEIKELKLYRVAAGSFEKYVQQRFEIGRAQAYRLIDAAQIDERLQVSPIGDKRPVNESQFRALACVDENHVCEVWQKAVETANKSGKSVSAKLVKEEIVKKHTEPTVEQEPDPEEIVDEVDEIEEEPTIAEICDQGNKAIESFCRAIAKQFENDVPKIPWTQDSGRIESALAALKSGLTTLRGAKAEVCPACVEGLTEKGKCRYCKGHGYLPVYQAKAIPQDARL
jgi:hypothetical protein